MIDEYYCPNCGSILNEQDGFDPNNDVWTCSQCGQLLYGDNIYQGDTYPGVMWYCDECGDLLNKQDSFRDYYGTHVCEKCGHLNTIDEDNVVNSVDNSESESIGEQLIGAFFNGVSQGINEYYEQDKSIENNCNDLLYPDVTWYCDCCGCNLSEQEGFTDSNGTWTCTECGFTNLINDDEILDDTKDTVFNHSNSNSSYRCEDTNPIKKEKKKGFLETINNVFVTIFTIAVICFLIFFGLKIYNEDYNPNTHPNQIKIKKSNEEYEKEDYMIVYRELCGMGFTNVKLEPLNDVILGWFAKEGEIDEILIDNGKFEANEWINKNADIIIKYHSKK